MSLGFQRVSSARKKRFLIVLTNALGLWQIACFMGGGKKREEKEERDNSQTFQGVIRVIHDGYSHSEKCTLNLITVPMMCGFLVLQTSWNLKVSPMPNPLAN